MRDYHMKCLRLAVLSVIVALSIGADVAGQGAPAQPAGQVPDGRGGGRGGAPGGGPFAKVPGQLASGWNAPSTVARTKLRHEWVDIPVGASKVHTWIDIRMETPGRLLSS